LKDSNIKKKVRNNCNRKIVLRTEVPFFVANLEFENNNLEYKNNMDVERYDQLDMLVNKFVFSKHLDDVASMNNRILAMHAKQSGYPTFDSPAKKTRRKAKDQKCQEVNKFPEFNSHQTTTDTMTKFYLDAFDESLLN